MAVHGGSTGERTIRLRRAGSVEDAYTGERVSEGAAEIRTRFGFGETRVRRMH